MVNDILLSIVIPVYNVERFLVKCVNSVLEQKEINFEIILVNDGSTDNCKGICEEYARNDDRITLLNKVNGGLSDARNFGLNHVKGKYVWFIDSDDYINLDSFRIIENILEMAPIDILLFNYQEVYNKKNIPILKFKEESEIFGRDSIISKYKGIGIQAWTQIYLVSFLKDNNLSFLKKSLYEDVLFNTKVYALNPRIKVINSVLYNYLQREGSIMNRIKSIKNLESLINIFNLYSSDEIQKAFPKNFIADRQHYLFLTINNSLKESNLSEFERLDFARKLKDQNFKILYRDNDTFISKKIKKIFLHNSECIYKNWKFIFYCIRVENLINKI